MGPVTTMCIVAFWTDQTDSDGSDLQRRCLTSDAGEMSISSENWFSQRVAPNFVGPYVAPNLWGPVWLNSLITSKSGPKCAVVCGPMVELTAVPGAGPLPGLHCKRQSMRPSATGKCLKWPMAKKRLNSTGLVHWVLSTACVYTTEFHSEYVR